MQQPTPGGVKLRVISRYRGAESDRFGGGAVPEGAKIVVDPVRARQLITQGLAAPIVGPSETKPAGPVEKKALSGTGGPAEPLSSLPAAQASLVPTATLSPPANASGTGAASPSRTTTGSSPLPTPSTVATRTGGARSTRAGARTSRS